LRSSKRAVSIAIPSREKKERSIERPSMIRGEWGEEKSTHLREPRSYSRKGTSRTGGKIAEKAKNGNSNVPERERLEGLKGKKKKKRSKCVLLHHKSSLPFGKGTRRNCRSCRFAVTLSTGQGKNLPLPRPALLKKEEKKKRGFPGTG